MFEAACGRTDRGLPMTKLHFTSAYRGETDYRVSGGPMDGQMVSIRHTTAEHHRRSFGPAANAQEALLLEAELAECGTVKASGARPISKDVALAAQAEQDDRLRRLADVMPSGALAVTLDVLVLDATDATARRVPIGVYCAADGKVAA
jgi:hypothetical protein